VFHVSIWGGFELCFGGISPPKPPVATGLGHGPDNCPFQFWTLRSMATLESYGPAHRLHPTARIMKRNSRLIAPLAWRFELRLPKWAIEEVINDVAAPDDSTKDTCP